MTTLSSVYSFHFQEHVNEIDFDYIEYARQRFEQYWSRKHDLLGSVAESK